jgi:hypothetical protein
MHHPSQDSGRPVSLPPVGGLHYRSGCAKRPIRPGRHDSPLDPLLSSAEVFQ